MKKTIIFLSILATTFAMNTGVKAQAVIMLEHQTGGSEYFYDLSTAIINAQSGDYLYLPGGTFSINFPLHKGITIIGAGHYPDSTLATNQTIITGNITIADSADALHLEGLYISGNIAHAQDINSQQRADNVIIRRCSFNSLTSLQNGYNQNAPDSCFSLNWQIVNNVVRADLQFGYLRSTTVKGNIVNGRMSGAWTGANIENNVFLYNSTTDQFMNDIRYSSIKNNIFMTEGSISYPAYACYAPACGSYGNTWMNNLFVTNATNFNPGIAIADINNIFSVPSASIFQGYTAGAFSYNNNLHLNASCLGVNAGTDGTDMGIYGSSQPYKEGAVPLNPHIYFKNIGSTTNPNGTLNINIKVKAQDN